MKDLKSSFTLLLIYLLIVFALAELPVFEGFPYSFSPYFLLMMILATLSTVLIPRFRWMKIYGLLAFWALVMMFLSVVSLPQTGANVQMLVFEFLLVEMAVWMAYELNRQISAAEQAIESLVSNTFPHRTIDMQKMGDQIDVELARSRRHHRPLTVLVIEPEKVMQDDRQKAYQVLRHNLLQHFTAASIGQIIAERARETDLIMRDRSGNFVILCAETDRESSNVLAERVEQAIHDHMGASVQWSAASFPDEALTFDELIQLARERLSATGNKE
jgi:hypothetical protein